MDVRTGDRMSGCRGLMDPIAIWPKESGEWAIIHRCRGCGILRANRVAIDDDERVLLALAVAALERPPFPLAKGTIAAAARSSR